MMNFKALPRGSASDPCAAKTTTASPRQYDAMVKATRLPLELLKACRFKHSASPPEEGKDPDHHQYDTWDICGPFTRKKVGSHEPLISHAQILSIVIPVLKEHLDNGSITSDEIDEIWSRTTTGFRSIVPLYLKQISLHPERHNNTSSALYGMINLPGILKNLPEELMDAENWPQYDHGGKLIQEMAAGTFTPPDLVLKALEDKELKKIQKKYPVKSAVKEWANFQDFLYWMNVQYKTEKTYETKEQKKIFYVQAFDNRLKITPKSSGNPIFLSKKELEKHFEVSCMADEKELFESKTYRYGDAVDGRMNSSYWPIILEEYVREFNEAEALKLHENTYPDDGSIDMKTNVEEFDNDPIPKLTKEDLDNGIKEIQEKLWVNPATINEIVINLLAGRNILLVGPVGTGKTELARMVPEILWKKHDGYFSEVYTATADWTTHDVIGGIMPKMTEENMGYTIEDGCVTRAVKENWNQEQSRRNYSIKKSAVDQSEKKFRGVWLVIDEFNRADIDKAFGQIFTAIETKILKIPTKQEKEFDSLSIPNDFRIIGTLNSADKHTLFKISDALKRRFAIINVGFPPLDEKTEEIKYSINNALDEIKHITSRERALIAQENGMAHLPYEILSFVRFAKPLGTAVLKSIYQSWLVGTSIFQSNISQTLDIALTNNLSPQLESLEKETLHILQEIVAENGDPIKVLQEKEKNKIERAEYAESFKIFLNFINIAGEPKDLFSEKDIKNRIEMFKQGTCFNEENWSNKLTAAYEKSYWFSTHFPKFADSIDDIRKNLI